MSKYMKRQNLIEILLLLVALNIFGAICFRPSVNLSCNCEIVFHDSQQSDLEWE